MVLGSRLTPQQGGVRWGGEGRAEAAGAALIAGGLSRDSKVARLVSGLAPGSSVRVPRAGQDPALKYSQGLSQMLLLRVTPGQGDLAAATSSLLGCAGTMAWASISLTP